MSFKKQLGRRGALKGTLAVTTVSLSMGKDTPAGADPSALAFDLEEPEAGNDVSHHGQ